MTDALTDLSADSLVAAMEGNFHDVWVEFARRGRRQVHLGGDVSWVMAAPAPWPSQVFGARFEDGHEEQRVKEIIEQMEAGQAPRRWVIGPSTRPVDLEARLERHGFVKVRQSPGMAIDMQDMDSSFPWPAGLTISRVSGDQELGEWAQVLVHGMFRGGKGDVQAFHHLLRGFDLRDDSRFYIGRYRGEAVATSMLFPSRGVAGIYHVVTLPAYRRRGIGKQITLAPLRDAHEMGYRLGILHASQLGQVIYRQIGFREYCSISTYELDERPGR